MKPIYLMTTAFLYSALTMAAYTPNDIRLGDPSYGGTGCPQGSASVAIAPDGQSLSVLFDRYTAEAGGTTGRSIDRKTCNLSLPVHVPQGFSVSVIEVDYRGFTDLPSGATSQLNVEYFFAGDRGTPASRSFTGTMSSDFMVSSDLIAVGQVWSDCGADVILRTNSSIQVRTNARNEQSQIAVDSVDISAGIIYKLQWKQCGAGPGPIPVPVPVPTYTPPVPPYYPPNPNPQPTYNPPVPPYYPPTNPPTGPSCGTIPVYPTIQTFASYEQDAIRFDQDFRRAPYGSWQERQADQNRREAVRRAIEVLNAQWALEGYSIGELENFALDMNRKYQQAPAGSVLENMYDQARRIVLNAIVPAGRREMECNGSAGYARTLQLADLFSQKYQQAPAGSQLEAAYRTLRDEAYTVAERQLRDYLAYSYLEFRAIEPMITEFHQQYQYAPAGSRKEAFYRNARTIAKDAALQAFRNVSQRMSYGELSQIEREYDQKYRFAPAGSILETYYRAIRDEARTRMGNGYYGSGGYSSGGYNPYPYPY